VEEASIDVLLLHIFANCMRNKKGYETEPFTEATTVHKKKEGLKRKGWVQMQRPCNIVSNHEEHLSQKGEKKNRKEIKICFTLEKIPLPSALAISSFSRTNFLL
jgi:hypothetical protein